MLRALVETTVLVLPTTVFEVVVQLCTASAGGTCNPANVRSEIFAELINAMTSPESIEPPLLNASEYHLLLGIICVNVTKVGVTSIFTEYSLNGEGKVIVPVEKVCPVIDEKVNKANKVKVKFFIVFCFYFLAILLINHHS